MFNNFMDYEYQPYHKIYVHEISKYAIYLGDVSAAMDMDFIQNEPIKLVVTAAKGMDQVAYPEGIVKHIIYPLLDAKTENISQFFCDFYDLVEKEIYFGNILVHCAAGISRSATLVIAYFMKKNNLSFKQAIKIVRDIRPIVLPNLGFERQLKEFEASLNKKTIKPPNSSEIDRKILINSSEVRKNLLSPSKVDFLPDINHLGKTSWFKKVKPLEKNVEYRMNIENMKDFEQRRFDIKTRKSEHDPKDLKKKGNHYRNASKEMIFAKMENGKRKLLERSNNFVSANFLNENNINMIEETPSLSIKKLSSLSHRSEKRSLDRKIIKNYSNHKYEKDPNLLEEMGRFVVSKLHLNERRFITEKQPRGRKTPQLAIQW